MNDQTITAIVDELTPMLVGRTFGKVFQLSRVSFAIDFRSGGSGYLFLSVEPAAPRLYMIERRTRDLEKQSLPLSSFTQSLRKQLGGATLNALAKDAFDRIVRFSFTARDEMGNTRERTLIAQLTGKAANLLLLDERGFVIDTLRPPRGEGQEIGERYQPPPAPQNKSAAQALLNDSAQALLNGSAQALHNDSSQALKNSSQTILARDQHDWLSAAADAHYLQLEAARAFDARAASVRSRLNKEIAQREKLKRHLAQDLAAHGDADKHKRLGDLLLANISTAERRGSTVALTDYYAEGAPIIELEIDEHATLQEQAAKSFARYAKAKRAAQEIAQRLETLDAELDALHERQTELATLIAERDDAALESFKIDATKAARPKQTREKTPEDVPGARRYRSSDGYEILVGRAARDNDHLTFRVARPHDLWLHAADYPGSHVVIRNPTRGEIPQRTVIEAAQLAAQFSQARRDAKVNVHYTPRKFLSKPKGSAHGLVRISTFRTLLVEPSESIERI
jgi:predicted ribosome quality control (RQC) complex YloA/Tae2 family protein